jgi:hypothetical protein
LDGGFADLKPLKKNFAQVIEEKNNEKSDEHFSENDFSLLCLIKIFQQC